MAGEGTLTFSLASVVEDVLQQHGNRLRDLDLESRKAEEAGTLFCFYSTFVLNVCEILCSVRCVGV